MALTHLIRPTLTALGEPFASPDAELMLLAIGLQESGFTTRRQTGGPARGFWQFERIAVADFIQRGTPRIKEAVFASGAPIDTSVLFSALAHPDGDALAVLLARDLLFRVPMPLPAIGDAKGAWQYYLAQWRPGKPAWARWTGFSYPTALRTCDAK